MEKEKVREYEQNVEQLPLGCLELGREWQPCPLCCAGSLGKVQLNPELQGQQELPWVFGWPW